MRGKLNPGGKKIDIAAKMLENLKKKE